MTLLTRLILAFVLTNVIAASADVCNVATVNLSIFQRNKRLAGFQYYLATDVPDIFQCARTCFFRRRCLSFNYFEKTSFCQLNNARVDAPQVILQTAVNWVYSDISYMDEAIGLGPCSKRPCGICEACYPTESSYICVLEEVTSCLDIKICTNASADGHYLVRPGSGTKPWLKIYCRGMSSKYPRDYLTLMNKNFFKFAPLDPNHCSTVNWTNRNPGVIYYNKIRMVLTLLRVIKEDKTFTSRSCDPSLFGISDPQSFKKSGATCKVNLGYGTSGDCMAGKCRPRKGVFRIDLRGTGLAVSPSVKWIATGHKSKITSLNRSSTNEVIEAVCGGHCGYCKPKGHFYLIPNPK